MTIRRKKTTADSSTLDKVAEVALTSAGAGVGGAGGATVGVLELAARGAATELSAGLVIGAGAAAGAALAWGVYKLFRKRKGPPDQGASAAGE